MANVRRGGSLRETARSFKVSLATVQHWVARAAGQRLDRVDWEDRPAGCPSPPNRTSAQVEHRVLDLRTQLREFSDLGEFGAAAIRRELEAQGFYPLPSQRTIGRILERHGALDGQRRQRRPAPPKGWYLPDLAENCVELDSFDSVEGLVLQGGPEVEVLNVVSLHGGLVGSWPFPHSLNTDLVLEMLAVHWRQFGLPAYAQFDNHPVFHGPHHYADVLSRVVRLCLALGVTPVFAPPRESGFQAAIENYNGRWQAKVWQRFHFPDFEALQQQSDKFVAACRLRSAARGESAPARNPFDAQRLVDNKGFTQGRIIYLRRTDDKGCVSCLGQRFFADNHWLHRLTRCEYDLALGNLKIFALRRREPERQSLLNEIPHQIRPKRGSG